MVIQDRIINSYTDYTTACMAMSVTTGAAYMKTLDRELQKRIVKYQDQLSRTMLDPCALPAILQLDISAKIFGMNLIIKDI